MMVQFCIMQGQSSGLPVSTFGFCNLWSWSLQPSRQRHGPRSSVDDSHFDNNSNRSNSHIPQFRPFSSLFSMIRLPQQSFPFCSGSTAGLIGATAWFVSAFAVGSVECFCMAVNTCQRPAMVFSSLLAPLVRLFTPLYLVAPTVCGSSLLWLVLASRTVC